MRAIRQAELQKQKEDRELVFKFVGGMATKAAEIAGNVVNEFNQIDVAKTAKELLDREDVSRVGNSLKTDAVKTMTKLGERLKNLKSKL